MQSKASTLRTLITLTILGCGGDPRRQQTEDYLSRLTPILHENSLLADTVLQQAALVHNGQVDPKAIVTAWSTDIAPMAQHVHTLAADVAPPEHLAADHAALVQIWQRRAEAYREVVESHQRADLESFTRAQRDIGTITVNEDQWVRAFNARLDEMKLNIDLYP
jgi:hypothetical protein